MNLENATLGYQLRVLHALLYAFSDPQMVTRTTQSRTQILNLWDDEGRDFTRQSGKRYTVLQELLCWQCRKGCV
jgi:hypothetical protein